MSILIQTLSGQVAAQSVDFALESELEKVIASRPDLLAVAGDQPLALVASQVDLPDAGILDLLFVSESGLPVAVEVKLAKNGESRRQFVAQIVDYLSSLTTLTVAELDAQVEGTLEQALRSFDASDTALSGFERRWQSVGANLRAGLARVVLVVDCAPSDLVRIVRFLGEHTNLDIRLVSVAKHEAAGIGAVFVPQVIVMSEGEPPPRPTGGPRPIREELGAVVTAFNQVAPVDLQASGNAQTYRQIRPREWPLGMKIHYEFVQTHGQIGAELHLENASAARLGPELARFSGMPAGPQRRQLQWEPTWSNGRGRLMVRYDPSEEPDTVVRTMLELIQLTRSAVIEIASRLDSAGVS